MVNAYIMPSIVSGSLNAPTIMTAEKSADGLRGLSTPGTPKEVMRR